MLLGDVILYYGGQVTRSSDWSKDMQATNELTGYGLNGSAYYSTTKVSLRALRALETVTVWLDKSHMHGAKVLTDAYETSTGEVVFLVRETIAFDSSLPGYGYTVAAIGRNTGTVVQLSARAEFETSTAARRFARAILTGNTPAPTLRGALLRAKRVVIYQATYYDRRYGNPYVGWSLIVDGVCRLHQPDTYGAADDALSKLNAQLGLGPTWRATRELLAFRATLVDLEVRQCRTYSGFKAYCAELPAAQPF